MSKETKPIKAVDDSYKALSNKDRFILFAKIFGTILAFAMVFLTCAGALNYGVMNSMHIFTIAGALTAILTIIKAVKVYKTYDAEKLLNRE
ncbi:MAG: hypothetical protein IKW20_02850 [Bacteroidales bacterium]|nr:hypothetical protein [Bacteroidales bacterium]